MKPILLSGLAALALAACAPAAAPPAPTPTPAPAPAAPAEPTITAPAPAIPADREAPRDWHLLDASDTLLGTGVLLEVDAYTSVLELGLKKLVQRG